MASSFAHLHVHTEYSMLDGASRIKDLIRRVAEDGQPAVGITDHGNLYGLVDLYKAAKAAGIKPILGTEAYQALESRHERPARRGSKADDSGGEAEDGGKLYYHLTLLAENQVGYRNLVLLSSRAFLEGFYYKPRVDWETLAEHSEGLIATTGCLGGQVGQRLLRDDVDGAIEVAGRLQDIFGRDNLFVELQDHGLEDQRRTMSGLLAVASCLDAPLLATNDSHYTDSGHAEAHDALLCVQTGARISDQDRFRFQGQEHYVKTAAQMRSLFADHPQACDSTLLVAERCNVELAFGKPQLPHFPLPEGYENDEAYLRALTLEGARARYGDQLPEAVSDRLSYELSVINSMGFDAYFLIVWDLVRHAKDVGCRVSPGRGSAAGCCVAYCLGITNIDPLRYNLLFERFLNPDRISMPDIDMDFESRWREHMVSYARDKYGQDRVASIITFSQIKARAAVRDAARVLGLSYGLGDRVAKLMPPMSMGRSAPLSACFEETEGHKGAYQQAKVLREFVNSDPDADRVVGVALGLEDLRRQDGIHAAGVVISREPLTDVLPVQRKGEGEPVVTQWNGKIVEELGLLKMDFLGVRNLDVITDTLALLEERGTDLDIDDIPLDDPATLHLLQAGETVGVFQLESPPMRDLLQKLRPTSFEDIAAVVALYRPGPMSANMHFDYAERKNGRKPVEYFHPDAKELLEDTYGLMVYQESVMRVAERFAGYTKAQADTLRKACGKKIREMMAKEREKFEAGVKATGYGERLGKTLFDIIEAFADYAFNKSHAVGYGMLAWQTAYLKANHPLEYFAALLTSVKGKTDKLAVALAECRRCGIKVLPPDVNRSGADFIPTPEGIVFALSAVRNVGETAMRSLVGSRWERPFVSLYDLCLRWEDVNKRTLTSLVNAGALDAFGPRKGLVDAHEAAVDLAAGDRARRAGGVQSMEALFGLSDEPEVRVPEVEYPRDERMALEKEMLGLYISEHPLDRAESRLRTATDRMIDDLQGVEHGASLTIGGLLSNVERRTTKAGKPWATFILEDYSGSTECVMFAQTLLLWGDVLEEAKEKVALVAGRVERPDEDKRAKFVVSSLEVLEEGEATFHVHLETPEAVDELAHVLPQYPGGIPVFVHVGGKLVRLPETSNVDLDGGLRTELRTVVGLTV